MEPERSDGKPMLSHKRDVNDKFVSLTPMVNNLINLSVLHYTTKYI